MQRSVLVKSGEPVRIYISGPHSPTHPYDSTQTVALAASYDDCPEGMVRLTAPEGFKIETAEANPCFTGHAFNIRVLQSPPLTPLAGHSAKLGSQSCTQLVAMECERCGYMREPTTAETTSHNLHERDQWERAVLALRERHPTSNNRTSAEPRGNAH